MKTEMLPVSAILHSAQDVVESVGTRDNKSLLIHHPQARTEKRRRAFELMSSGHGEGFVGF
jgi:hypothetical protein